MLYVFFLYVLFIPHLFTFGGTIILIAGVHIIYILFVYYVIVIIILYYALINVFLKRYFYILC